MSLKSNIRPRNLVSVTKGMIWPEMKKTGLGGGLLRLVKAIARHLSAAKENFHLLAHSSILFKRGCMILAASFSSSTVMWVVMSSQYVIEGPEKMVQHDDKEVWAAASASRDTRKDLSGGRGEVANTNRKRAVGKKALEPLEKTAADSNRC